ncbi:hypothetical protein CKO40_22300 [Halochromatium glycolicum]|uniref:Uncharacterized protein n=1 Tax=Halochromatium glycolicum TaxID=85075 RepID=A0AAJ0U8K0_9GAMM|nr:hypothetical protein [Halochromatium glycolicum]
MRPILLLILIFAAVLLIQTVGRDTSALDTRLAPRSADLLARPMLHCRFAEGLDLKAWISPSIRLQSSWRSETSTALCS